MQAVHQAIPIETERQVASVPRRPCLGELFSIATINAITGTIE
jgi:hypothetical protein